VIKNGEEDLWVDGNGESGRGWLGPSGGQRPRQVDIRRRCHFGKIDGTWEEEEVVCSCIWVFVLVEVGSLGIGRGKLLSIRTLNIIFGQLRKF